MSVFYKSCQKECASTFSDRFYFFVKFFPLRSHLQKKNENLVTSSTADRNLCCVEIFLLLCNVFLFFCGKACFVEIFSRSVLFYLLHCICQFFLKLLCSSSFFFSFSFSLFLLVWVLQERFSFLSVVILLSTGLADRIKSGGREVEALQVVFHRKNLFPFSELLILPRLY